MKNFFVRLLTGLFILVLVVPNSAYAISKNRVYSEEPLTGIKSKDPNHGKSIIQQKSSNTKSSNNTFTVGEVGINDEGHGELSAYGCTAATGPADEIGYKLYIQQWDGYEWMDVCTISNTDYDEMEISQFHFRNVLRGCNYRIKAVHHVIDNSEFTGGTHYSTYIKIE